MAHGLVKLSCKFLLGMIARAFGSIESDANECPTRLRGEVAVSPRNRFHEGMSEADDEEALLEERQTQTHELPAITGENALDAKPATRPATPIELRQRPG